jgi:AcrR family transcriptional regulator
MADQPADAIADGPRRRYNSPVRRRQAEQTRERIVSAGADIVRELPTWDWRLLTFSAVADRAGVGRRTVFNHFPTEDELRAAVLQRLEECAGVDYEQVSVNTVADVSAHVFSSLQDFASSAADVKHVEPAFYSAFHRRRQALVRAIDEAAPQWSPAERRAATALLDLLWDVSTFHRLTSSWRLNNDDAATTLGWAITLITDAVNAGKSPLSGRNSGNARKRRRR